MSLFGYNLYRLADKLFASQDLSCIIASTSQLFLQCFRGGSGENFNDAYC